MNLQDAKKIIVDALNDEEVPEPTLLRATRIWFSHQKSSTIDHPIDDPLDNLITGL